MDTEQDFHLGHFEIRWMPEPGCLLPSVLCKGVMWCPHEGQDLEITIRILTCSEPIGVVLMLWLIAVCQ